MNACFQFRTRLANLLAGRASSASFGELAWHEHLSACTECRALIEAEEALEHLLASLPEPQLPPELAGRLLARLEPVRGESMLDSTLDSVLERGDEVAVPKALAARMLSRLDGARTAQRGEAELDRVLARLPAPEVPEELARRTLARLALARRPRRASQPRLALAAAALLALGIGAWLLTRGVAVDENTAPEMASGPTPRAPAVAPRERVLDEPPADLLASLDLLESWDLVVEDSVEADVLALDAFDALLLDVVDELGDEPRTDAAPERRNG